ncbi:MAG: hypothetical protein JSR93_02170 [Verrucomicrobia bacterium]|nr:hypothetical protein [Verrucomicrobiota bacterium]
MQAQLDTSLIKLWLIICDDLDFQGAEKPKNIQEIREWINLPSNEEQLRHVTQLNLSDQRFAVTPLEISKFKNLKSLDFQGNKLRSNPDALCSFKKLHP